MEATSFDINGQGTPPRLSMFGIQLDCVDLAQAVRVLQGWIAEGQATCRYVVTPNVDHLVMLRHDTQFQQAYRHASLVVADGFPVVIASRLLGKPLPERVTGADLVPGVMASATPDRPLRVFLLGAAPGVAERAAAGIQSQYEAVRVVGTCSPPLGFQDDERASRAILAQIEAAPVDLLVVGLGAPKQELWVHRHQQQLRASVAVCAGATIDFLAGQKPRAPKWMQHVGLEWFYRLLSEPRRLGRRYALDAWVFPQLLCREWIEAADPPPACPRASAAAANDGQIGTQRTPEAPAEPPEADDEPDAAPEVSGQDCQKDGAELQHVEA